MLYFDAHTHKSYSDKKNFSIENKYPNSIDFSKPFSIGIHPWFINKNDIEKELLVVESQLKNNNCFALGECGLDKLSKTDFELQIMVFKAQIVLSEKYKKPLIIHCVKAFQEIIEFKKELKPKQNWIVHGFTKNIQIAKSLLKNEIILSFGTAILHNTKLQEVFLELPFDKILLETDDSENSIKEVYQKASEIKNIEVAELQQKIEQNFTKIFYK